jgi:hypothetical protein
MSHTRLLHDGVFSKVRLVRKLVGTHWAYLGQSLPADGREVSCSEAFAQLLLRARSFPVAEVGHTVQVDDALAREEWLFSARSLSKGDYVRVVGAFYRVDHTETCDIVEKLAPAEHSLELRQEYDVLLYLRATLRSTNVAIEPFTLESRNAGAMLLRMPYAGYALIDCMHSLTPEQKTCVFGQVVRAVAAIHDVGVAHRDLKADNIVLDANLNAKLIDFGFSVRFAPEKGTTTGPCGSAMWAAPEVFRAPTHLYQPDLADLWSVGILAFGLWFGRCPFRAAVKKEKNYVLFRSNLASSQPFDALCLLNDDDAYLRAAPAWVVDAVDSLLHEEPTKRRLPPSFLSVV